MGEFEAIRPYNDAEVPAVLQRLLSDDAFLGILARYRYPRLSRPFGWLLRPLIAHRLAREVTGIRSVVELQDKCEPYVDRTIEHATVGPNVSLGAGSTVRHATLRDTVAGDKVHISHAALHDSFLGDQVVVEGVKGRLTAGDHSEIRVDA